VVLSPYSEKRRRRRLNSTREKWDVKCAAQKETSIYREWEKNKRGVSSARGRLAPFIRNRIARTTKGKKRIPVGVWGEGAARKKE